MTPPIYAALLSIARALVEPNTKDLSDALLRIDDWQAFANQLENHGLSVMLAELAKKHTINLPRNLELQLKALSLRHQKVRVARHVVLADVIDIFEENSIEFALLKGAALSELVYDPPWSRPMRDIDILVNPDKAQDAQKLLRSIGFSNEDFKAGYLFEHHHLPNSTRTQDGFKISLEVHHDALSGDVDASIKLNNLEQNLTTFDLAGKQAHALGHTDMLKHLCHHTFEPADYIKLGSIIDMISYAKYFADQINWQDLKQKHPNIDNAFRCIDALIPMPESLKHKMGGKWLSASKLKGVGRGFFPLSQINRLNNPRDKVRAMLIPSAWWSHIFYAVPPQKSLWFVRAVRHPFQMGKWLFRRYRAAHKSRSQ